MPGEDEAHDGGLAVDILRIVDRRGALRLIGLGAIAIAGCRASTKVAQPTVAATTPGASASAAADCVATPEETGGPFPADGSNGPNVLTQSGIVRRDITKSFGSSSGVAQGVPLAISFTVLSLHAGCKPYKGAAVYAWHCDREGNYSLYSQNASGENYLRGVQVADANGVVTFDSIFPACYPGRWPHVHFEVYPDLNAASRASGKLRTSQIALPKDACEKVYAKSGYEQSVQSLTQVSLTTDMVFSDGYSAELGKITGAASSGMTCQLTVAV